VTANNGSQSARVRKLHLLAHEIGLDHDECIELTQYILRRPVVSWKNLPDDHADRLLDALQGFQLVSQLIRMRP
jgi:hypothetical protein